jgi:hypothetical protein
MTYEKYTRLAGRVLAFSLLSIVLDLSLLLSPLALSEKALQFGLLVLVLAVGLAVVSAFCLLGTYAERKLEDRIRQQREADN